LVNLKNVSNIAFKQINNHLKSNNNLINNNKAEKHVYARMNSYDTNKDGAITSKEFGIGLKKSLNIKALDVDKSITDKVLADIVSDVFDYHTVKPNRSTYISRETDVEELKQFLVAQLGLDAEVISNALLSLKDSAQLSDIVSNFQKQNGLDDDGELGLTTLKKMVAKDRKTLGKDFDPIGYLEQRMIIDFSNIKSSDEVIKFFNGFDQRGSVLGMLSSYEHVDKVLAALNINNEKNRVSALKKIPKDTLLVRAYPDMGTSFLYKVKPGDSISKIAATYGFKYGKDDVKAFTMTLTGNKITDYLTELKADKKGSIKIKPGQILQFECFKAREAEKEVNL